MRKIVDYIVVEGETNIKNFIIGGMEPYGHPMLKGGGFSGNAILQVLVRYEEEKVMPLVPKEVQSKVKEVK